VLCPSAISTTTQQRHAKRLEQKNIQAVIPPKSNRVAQREYDKELYKARHLIENFFLKLKQFRPLQHGTTKTARNFLGAIFMASVYV
jgi:transposase